MSATPLGTLDPSLYTTTPEDEVSASFRYINSTYLSDQLINELICGKRKKPTVDRANFPKNTQFNQL